MYQAPSPNAAVPAYSQIRKRGQSGDHSTRGLDGRGSSARAGAAASAAAANATRTAAARIPTALDDARSGPTGHGWERLAALCSRATVALISDEGPLPRWYLRLVPVIPVIILVFVESQDVATPLTT